MSRSVTVADVRQRDRSVVPGNLSTLILGQTLPMCTTWAHTHVPPGWRHGENRSAWPKYFKMFIPRQTSLAMA